MALALVGISDDQFRKDLQRRYRILEMPHDNNCTFSAMALARYGSVTYQNRSRRDIKAYIVNNFDYFAGFIDFNDPDIKEEYEQMEQNENWGGDLALSGACNAYNFAIVMEQPGLPVRNYNPSDSVGTPTTVHISYHNGDHYNLLIPLSPPNPNAALVPPRNDEGDDEDESDEDESDEDDGDNDGSSGDEEEDSVLDLDGFPYAAHAFFKKARDDVVIGVLVPGANLKHQNLLQAINIERPPFVRFVTLYNRRDVLELLSDEDVNAIYTVYMQNFKLPLNMKYHDRALWLSEALIVPLLLSIVGFNWDNVDISVLCKKSKIAIPMILLNKAWNQVRESVMRELGNIIASPNSFFCVNCTSSCPHFGKPWHTNPKDYLVKEISDGSDGFFEIFSTNERPNMEFIDPVFKKLMSIKLSNVSPVNKLKALQNELDKNANDDWYATYLVLHLDGNEIEKYDSDQVFEMLLDANIKKSVYVGTTTNRLFRRQHFRNRDSSIFKVLTRTSRLYFIRSVRFGSLKDATLDEAIVIEILKTYLNWRWQTEKSRPFLLLNIRTEARPLLLTDDQDKAKVVAFARSGIPILRCYPLLTTQFDYGRFPGNFEVVESIPMRDGPYLDRNFNDANIQSHYLWLEGRIIT